MGVVVKHPCQSRAETGKVSTTIYGINTVGETQSIICKSIVILESGFDDGVAGQPITLIIGDANTILDFSASNLKGNAGVDYTATANDVAVFVTNDGTTWYAIGPFQNG